MPFYGIQLATWVFQALSEKCFLLILSLFSSPSSPTFLYCISLSLSLPSSRFAFFFYFPHSISARSQPTSLVSRSQVGSLMELFRRTISRARYLHFSSNIDHSNWHEILLGNTDRYTRGKESGWYVEKLIVTWPITRWRTFPNASFNDNSCVTDTQICASEFVGFHSMVLLCLQ